MNKTLLIFLTILISNVSFAQFSLGYKIGSSLSTVRYDNEDVNNLMKTYLKPKMGFTVGAVMEYYFIKGLAIEADITYIGKGFKWKQPYNEGKKRFDYIQLNAAGKVNLVYDRDYSVSLYVAPFLSYWYSGIRTESDYRNQVMQKEKIVFADSVYSYNRYDVGLVGGVEINFRRSRYRNIILNIQYEHSFLSNDINKVDGTLNRTLIFGFIYLFKFK